MQKFIISFLIGLLCSLQVGAFAATTQTIHVEWGYTAPSSPAVTGFKLYQEGALACQTQNPNAKTLDCQVSLTKDTTNFTLTATFSDNTESPHSAPFPYTIPSGASLTAIITTNATSGTAPLAISFNASASIGTIASYLWDFGDGSTATTQSAPHTYANAGTYTAKLTIADASGKTSFATTTVTVASAPTPVPTTPPTAVISSSAATGPAPLAVSLDGSGSTATNATIAAYNWSFGDGTTASGAKVAHSYTSAGTYSATLTVTDSKGLSSQASTPVIATTPTATNTAPKAVISATPINGTAPLAVTFNGGNSTDSDGSIAGYTWNFGDGSTASGKTVSHTYTTNATFTATLEVVDDKGAKGSASTTITVTAQNKTPQLKIETGEVAVSSTWVRVPLETTFANPIVVAGPPSFNNNQPCVVQLRNVDATGFDVRIKEWNYLDGTHPQETISYIVMEKGRHALPDGSSVEAGTFAGSTSFKTIAFSKAFTKAPVVLTTVASAKEADTISGRLKSITTSGFAYYYREQERNRNTHVTETINYVAWEPGKGTIGSVQFEVSKTASTVTNSWSSITYQSTYATPPLLIADMQTATELDTSALRVQQISAVGFQIKVEEEQSKDTETTHAKESVGYIALNQGEEAKALATFTWEFDTAQEVNISGFQLLVNGEKACTSSNPTDRQLSCEISAPSGPTSFAIQTIEKAGGNSTPSISINYVP